MFCIDSICVDTSSTLYPQRTVAVSSVITACLCGLDMYAGLFPVNVPYMIPVEAFGIDEHYKILADRVVLFKPQEWRGTTCPGTSQCPTADQMAARLNGFPRGTVSNIYVTSDGGGNLQMLYDMVAQLDEHVELVNQEIVVRAALSRGAPPVVGRDAG